jgi:hypothetical protein
MTNTEIKENVKQILGMICLLFGVPGVVAVAIGGYMTIMTVILSATGFDATGLGAAIGLPILIGGLICSWPLFIGIGLLNLHKKYVAFVTFASAFITFLFFVPGAWSWKTN